MPGRQSHNPWAGAKTIHGAAQDLPTVEIHYEIYDGLPLFSKWLVVRNDTKAPIRVNEFVSEELRLAEVESTVEAKPDRERPNLWVETDYAFGAMDAPHAAAKSVFIGTDPDYPTQVNYDRKTLCLLRTKPPIGPDQEIPPGSAFESFRAFELLLDSSDRERRGLAQRRMYRTIAPWTAENPLMFHLRKADAASVRVAITQASEVGFEMIIMSFGSGFNFESKDAQYQTLYQTLAAEAKEKGLALGGYSLLASRGAADKRDNTQGQPAMYGVMPCLGSKWGTSHLDQLKQFAAPGRLRRAGTRWLVPRRHVREQGPPRPPRAGRFPMGAVAGHHRPIQVVPIGRHLSQYPRLVFPHGRK